MRTLVNTLHLDDYFDIKQGVEVAKNAVSVLQGHRCPIVIPHEHRWWEYGTGIQMMLDHYKEKMPQIDILDVGSGWSGFGPSVNYTFNSNVIEYEPVAQYRNDREQTIAVLHSFGKKGIYLHGFGIENMPAQDYDVVCCISVLEHVPKNFEKQAWKELAARVRKGGLMYMTTDVVEDPTVPHVFDELRVMPNYTLPEMKERVEMLRDECHMIPLGIPNYKWNGNHVHDFTFFRAGFMKA